MKLNNKGQSLVLFVLLMPILLMVMVLVYDGGIALYEKEKLDNVNDIAVNYGLDNIGTISESDLIDLIVKNTDDVQQIEVIINGSEITSSIEKKNKSIIGQFMRIKVFEITSKYQGKIVDDKKEIERVK